MSNLAEGQRQSSAEKPGVKGCQWVTTLVKALILSFLKKWLSLTQVIFFFK